MRNRTRKYRKKQRGGTTKKQWIDSFLMYLKDDYEKNIKQKQLWDFWYNEIAAKAKSLEGVKLRNKIIEITKQIIKGAKQDWNTQKMKELLQHLEKENEPDHKETVFYHENVPEWIKKKQQQKEVVELKDFQKDADKRLSKIREDERQYQRLEAIKLKSLGSELKKELEDEQEREEAEKKMLIEHSLPHFRQYLSDPKLDLKGDLMQHVDVDKFTPMKKRADFVTTIVKNHPEIAKSIYEILEVEKISKGRHSSAESPVAGIIEIREIFRKRKKTPKQRTKRRRKRYGTKKRKRASRHVPIKHRLTKRRKQRKRKKRRGSRRY